MQDDLEVTGISRSGRVRKKSSKLMDFESPDDIEARYRRQTPVKSYGQFKSEEQEFADNNVQTPRPMEEGGTASGSESDYYENNVDVNGESMDSDSSNEEFPNAPRNNATPANSLYMMEKSTKKKLIVKDGKVIGRAKAQRKDKGKTRITAYMMWAKEARNDLLRKHPDMDFSAISKRLGEMWANVNYNERYLWKRKAKRFALQKEQSLNAAANKVIYNSKSTPRQYGSVGRPPRVKPQASPTSPPAHSLLPASSSGSPGAGAGATAGAGAGAGAARGGCGAAEVAAHLRLLGESLAIIGERLKEHEGQIAVSGSVSVLLDTLLCSLAPLVAVCRAIPAIAPPPHLPANTLHNIAYIMPGL